MTTPTPGGATRRSRHLVTSHGADFFGQDRYPIPLVTALADYVRSVVPSAQLSALAGPLAALTELDQAVTDKVTAFPPATASALADALLRVSRLRSVKPGTSATARLLANSGALAASSGEPWQWHIEYTAGGEH
ncbi:hypothetical protein ACF09E_34935 [Streptomyces sp. NPDC014891]|uniref:DUF7739 domain-containing protein n=1 Tax=Streptomyces sp. NPDC014891 TaxID=3364929 RepID=UPI0036FE56E3